MPDQITIEYERLCNVSIMHDAWLTRDDTPFERQDQTTRDAVQAAFDSRKLLRIVPTKDCRSLMQSHDLKLVNNANGFFVAARVTPGQGGGTSVLAKPLEEDFLLRFLVLLAEDALPNYSNLPFISGGGFYRFGTQSNNFDSFGSHLTQGLPEFDDQKAYQLGDVFVDAENAHRFVALTNTGPGPIQAVDWVQTSELPDENAGPFNPGDIHQGDQIRRDGFAYEALVNNPGNNLNDQAAWQQLYPISFQAISQRDRISLQSGNFEIDVSAASVSSIHFELLDETGRHLQWQHFESVEPIVRVVIDLSNFTAGIYQLRLTTDDGRLLEQAPLQVMPSAQQTVYVDNEAVRHGAFGVVEIGISDVGYELLNNDDSLRSPTFLLRFLNRLTTWQYHFPRDLTAAQISAVPTGLTQEGARVLRSINALPLGGDFVSLDYFDSGQLLPNPRPDQPLRLVNGRLVTDLFLNH